jgi:hypothetical protein
MNNPNYPEYEIKWESEQPKVGIECPICKKGFIELNDFTDKKGQKWYSVICKKCLVKWMSKYPPKGTEATQKPELGAKTGNEIEGLRFIYAELREINKKLDGLLESSVIYPNDNSSEKVIPK